ncbi:hypothetical protein JHK85_039228 [Glycine max]|nr:hypothetical protein JHK85_039228 [Glycine max]
MNYTVSSSFVVTFLATVTSFLTSPSFHDSIDTVLPSSFPTSSTSSLSEKPFSEEETGCFMRQQGLSHMHKKGFFHRDLKPFASLTHISYLHLDYCNFGTFGFEYFSPGQNTIGVSSSMWNKKSRKPSYVKILQHTIPETKHS